MMKGLQRGGAASKTPDFCCVCDTINTIRGNLILTKDGEEVEIGPGSFHLAIEEWNRTKDPSIFQPVRFPISEDTHVRILFSVLYFSCLHLSTFTQPDALPGLTPLTVCPCIMHGDQRTTNNELWYGLQMVSLIISFLFSPPLPSEDLMDN